MLEQAVWVHGASVMPQRSGRGVHWNAMWNDRRDGNGPESPLINDGDEVDWSDFFGLRSGGGATYRGVPNTTNRYFCSIPTPTWQKTPDQDAQQARVAALFFLFRTGSDAEVVNLHAHDGEHFIFGTIQGVPAARGDFSAPVQDKNMFAPVPPPRRGEEENPFVWNGINMGVEVRFHDEGGETHITFIAFGAHFLLAWP